MIARVAVANQRTGDPNIWVDSISVTEATRSGVRLLLVDLPLAETPSQEYATNLNRYLANIQNWDPVHTVFGLASIVGTSSPAVYQLVLEEVPDQLPIYASLATTWAPQVHFESFKSSTTPRQHPEAIDERIEALFAGAREQIFEDGIQSDFSRQLVSLIKKYGDAAMEVIAYLFVYEKINPEVAAEGLRWLGCMDHRPTYRYRLWLAERSLHSPSPRVRDGAVLALAYLNDPASISHLKQAIDHETIEELREDMKQVLAYLQASH